MNIRCRTVILTLLLEAVILFAIVIVFTSASTAGEVVVQWDRNADADYYELYVGKISGNYTTTYKTTELRYVVIGLENCVRYYFSVKAFNSCGNSSEFSDSVFSFPTLNPITGFRLSEQ